MVGPREIRRGVGVTTVAAVILAAFLPQFALGGMANSEFRYPLIVTMKHSLT